MAVGTTIRVSVDTLDERFVESLREMYPHASLEIKVDRSPRQDLPSEKEMWALIQLLDWSKTGSSNEVIEPAVNELARRPLHYIYEFQNWLSEKLFALDTRQHAEQTGENAYSPDEESFFSPDEFLYARCAVVANGKKFYDEVLKNPAAMPKDVAFEALLRIARLAYKNKTGQEFRYIPTHHYETFGNKSGWLKTSEK
ncbi:MAG TPA: DUF4240 domain-containing protein [Saprospiraceae bacterium]|nr:DUF4240 domain-containing protein [Saprospiraceae bacterium]